MKKGRATIGWFKRKLLQYFPHGFARLKPFNRLVIGNGLFSIPVFPDLFYGLVFVGNEIGSVIFFVSHVDFLNPYFPVWLFPPQTNRLNDHPDGNNVRGSSRCNRRLLQWIVLNRPHLPESALASRFRRGLNRL